MLPGRNQMRPAFVRTRRIIAAVALATAALAGPLAPAAHAKGTPAQCEAVRNLTAVNPDPTQGAAKIKAELAKLKAAQAKIPSKLKADGKKLQAFWEAIVKWTAKYRDPSKAMTDPRGLADYGKLMEKVTTDVTPAVQHITDWAYTNCI